MENLNFYELVESAGWSEKTQKEISKLKKDNKDGELVRGPKSNEEVMKEIENIKTEIKKLGRKMYILNERTFILSQEIDINKLVKIENQLNSLMYSISVLNLDIVVALNSLYGSEYFGVECYPNYTVFKEIYPKNTELDIAKQIFYECIEKAQLVITEKYGKYMYAICDLLGELDERICQNDEKSWKELLGIQDLIFYLLGKIGKVVPTTDEVDGWDIYGILIEMFVNDFECLLA